ncbi:DUF4234 domain-containing protein [Actinomadura alba]|uniref:DUF4234 domain-containing protein n=1 Tax=Actinomadura alba TaxID=406431 RepID=A0ABR7M0H5_9ACTN|nr:DUF4234 domain-containing protein [Actinomadura alba]MBC6470309.1 DUF4234 domain-containing protein [Actinomadura alba]
MNQPQQSVQQQSYAQPGQGPAAASGLQMKRRNPIAVWLGLPIITFGIYGIVWYVKVHGELERFDPRHKVGTTSAVLSIFFGWITLGIWNLVVWVKLAGHIANAQRAAGLTPSCNGGIGFLLGIFGFGSLYYQLELNKIVDRYGDVPAGTQVPLAA